ncbi:unnamed protein product [Rhizoctonia solani]|nr:unnamed protein product [Rhizoctonia solani]
MNLTDQLEWDINNPRDSLEEFAEVYCKELRLNGKFKTVVAHSIRGQVSIYQKSLFLTRHPFDGAPSSTTNSGRLWINTSFPFDRTLLEQFTPQFNVLQEAEIKRNQREQERELKFTYRHATAAAASLTIAKLAATENGTSPRADADAYSRSPPVLVHHQQQQQQQQQVPPPQLSKQKRQRTGILQPPPLPNHGFISRRV